MNEAKRRDYQAQMTIKYCEGSARLAQRTCPHVRLFSWGRRNVQLGLEEKRSGTICMGLQPTNSGAKKTFQIVN